MASFAFQAEALGRVEVGAGLDGGPGDLEHRQVTGDAAAVTVLARLPGGDVVADGDDAHVDPLGAELLGSDTEVEHVSGVVAEAEDHAAAVLGVAGHGVDLVGRRGGEDVAAGRTVGEAGAHPAGEGRVVAGAAADHEGRLTGGVARSRTTPPCTRSSSSGWAATSPSTASAGKVFGSSNR